MAGLIITNDNDTAIPIINSHIEKKKVYGAINKSEIELTI